MIRKNLIGDDNISFLKHVDSSLGKNVMIPEEYKNLAFKPLNVDFYPIYKDQELQQPDLNPLSRSEIETMNSSPSVFPQNSKNEGASKKLKKRIS